MHVSSAIIVMFSIIRHYPMNLDIFHGHFRESYFRRKIALLSISTNIDPSQRRGIKLINVPLKSMPFNDKNCRNMKVGVETLALSQKLCLNVYKKQRSLNSLKERLQKDPCDF